MKPKALQKIYCTISMSYNTMCILYILLSFYLVVIAFLRALSNNFKRLETVFLRTSKNKFTYLVFQLLNFYCQNLAGAWGTGAK